MVGIMELVITLLAVSVGMGVVMYVALVKARSRGLPPGGKGLPLLGETLEFLRCLKGNRVSEFVEKRRAKYGGAQLFRTSLFFQNVVVMGGAEDSRFLFRFEDKLVKDWLPNHFLQLVGSNTIAVQSGQHHRHLRRLLTTCLCPEALQSFAPTLDQLTQQHLANHWLPAVAQVPPKNRLRAYNLLQNHMLEVSAALLLGIHDKPTVDHLAAFFPTFIAGSNIGLPIYLPGTRFYKACSARSELHVLIRRIMSQRRQEMLGRMDPTSHDGPHKSSPSPHIQFKDLLSILISSVDEHGKPLSDLEILDTLVTVLFAGHDTTASTMSIMCKFLSANPTCYEQVLREQMDIAKSKVPGEVLSWEDVLKMNYTWMVVQETLRLQPSCVVLLKEALVEFEYKGFKIPRGWKVMHYLANSNSDEKCFLNANQFNPSRFKENTPARCTFLPFNGGSHFCAGMQVAQMAILVFFHYLVTKVKWTLVNPSELILFDPLPTPTNGLLLSVEERVHYP